MLARIVDISTDPKTNILKVKIVEGQIEPDLLSGNNNTKDYVILREV